MLHLAWEWPRVLFEANRLGYSWPLLLQRAPRGDGHPVLVLPGFMAGDGSTLILRHFLSRLGYVALPWLHGRNTGKLRQLEGAIRRFYRAYQVSGQKISLVGQSLGGVYAREFAREFPDAVRCVITLGSPFAGDDEYTTIPLIKEWFEAVSGHTEEELRQRSRNPGDPRAPLGLPSTAIYSKTDGITHWRMCVDRENDLAENVEVRASHIGMAVNPDVLQVVADRLAQSPQDWKKFDRSAWCRRWIYPEPVAPDMLAN